MSCVFQGTTSDVNFLILPASCLAHHWHSLSPKSKLKSWIFQVENELSCFFCCRALLQQAKVLALDEATANVDRATDALIQKALRDFAHGSTDAGRVLLVIAHR